LVGRSVDLDHALLLEGPRGRAARAELPAVLVEELADLGGRAVAVVGHHLEEEERPRGADALVEELFVRDALELARALLDGAGDVLARHVRVARGVEGATEPRVTVGVAAAEPRRDRDLLDDLREDLAALRVLGALPVLDRGPFVVAAHRFSCGALDTSEGAPSLPTGVLGDVDDPPFVALPLEDDDEACG